MKKVSLLFICLWLCGCVSPEERAAAQYRMRETLKTQCMQTLGFKAGTQDYMNCQMFQDKVMEANHFYISNASFRSSDLLDAYIKNQNETCYYYWGSNNIDKKALMSVPYISLMSRVSVFIRVILRGLSMFLSVFVILETLLWWSSMMRKS